MARRSKSQKSIAWAISLETKKNTYVTVIWLVPSVMSIFCGLWLFDIDWLGGWLLFSWCRLPMVVADLIDKWGVTSSIKKSTPFQCHYAKQVYTYLNLSLQLYLWHQIVLQLLPFLQNRCTKNAPWQISAIRDEKMWVFDDNNNALTFWCNNIHLSMKALKSWSYSILYLSLSDFAHKLPSLFMFKVDCYPEINSQKETIDSNAKSYPRLSDFNAIFFENLPGKCSK